MFRRIHAGIAVLFVAVLVAACGAATEESDGAQDVGRQVNTYDEPVRQATNVLCYEIGKEIADDVDTFDTNNKDGLGSYGYLIAIYWDFCMEQDDSRPGVPQDDPPGDG
jgi:hypothetical protein